MKLSTPSMLLKHLCSSLAPREIIHTTATLIDKVPYNHDCVKFRLKFNDKPFMLNIGQHLRIIQTVKTQDKPEGEEFIRKYTPISPCNQHVTSAIIKDILELLIKIYRADGGQQTPKGRQLTAYLDSLKIGESVRLGGPYGKLSYQSGGKINLSTFDYDIEGEIKKYKRIFFIAGGTGVIPCYQLIRQISKMKE